MEEEDTGQDICRVCRTEALPLRPLYHPCICTGSIKFVHQECLMQWLRYSKKEYCELCNHKFSFMPIYAPDMPKRLPTKDIVHGLLASVGKALKCWLHYTLVWISWLLVVPITAARIYKCIFALSFSSLFSLPLDLMSTENVMDDGIHGGVIVISSLCFFIAIVWLREQIVHGIAPDWLEPVPRREEREEPRNGLLIEVNMNGDQNADAPDGAAAGDQVVEEPPVEEAPAAAQRRRHFYVQEDGSGSESEEEREMVEMVMGALDRALVEDDNAMERRNDVAEEEEQGNWNQEFERLEDITWQRLLGLDGSLVFLEHMFWVLSLNTLFMIAFGLVPYTIGEAVESVLGLATVTENFRFRGFFLAIIGYVVFAFFLMALYTISQGMTLRKARRTIGLCYLIIKVSLLSIAEVGIFPIMCGAWLNVCSMELFGNSMAVMQAQFKNAPATNAFLHWLVGMIYIYYLAFFVLLLREIVRPGVLWFLQNINNPDFHPIQEMIQKAVIVHARRSLLSLIVFGTAILLMVWVPLRMMKVLTPSLIPYNVSMQTADMPTTELSIELLILQIVLPALAEAGHTKQFVKWFVRLWCKGVSSMLGIRSFLLGDQPEADDEEEDDEQEDQPRELGAVHQALINPQVQSPHQPYIRPSFFHLRIAALLLCICVSFVIVSFICLTVPVSLGKWTLGFVIRKTKLHEFYTVGAGLYLCWLICRAISLARNWLPRGWNTIYNSLYNTCVIGVKALITCSMLLGVIPLLIGIHFDLIIIIPLRVPMDATPVMYLVQDWALGVLHMKIIGALTFMGPNFWLKIALEQIYREGLRNMSLRRIFRDIVIPCIMILGLSLSLPYIFVHSFLSRFASPMVVHQVFRRIYPTFLCGGIFIWFALIQWKHFRRLYEHIRNDKYLLGKRLVNYDHHNRQTQPQQEQTAQ